MEKLDPQQFETQALSQISQCSTLEELRVVETNTLGKKSEFARAHGALGAMEPEQRNAYAASLYGVRESLTSAFSQAKTALTTLAYESEIALDRLDLSQRIKSALPGRLHLITKTMRELEDIFVGMGFDVFYGNEAETDEMNFTKLNFAPSHPARTMHDTFFLDLGDDEQVLMRTHTSPMQLHVMAKSAPPIYAVMPGRCYRVDTPDARHLPVFHQIEALVIDKDISMGHLAATIETFIAKYFKKSGLKVRLRPAYFPFTEPSAEFEITCPFCESGCRVCSGTQWIELGGCGMVHPNVLRNGGIDPKEWSGFAWGFGIDRLAMNKHEIEDLRVFIDNDERLLSQF